MDLVTNEEVRKYLGTTEDYSEEITRASTIVVQLLGNPVIHTELTEYHDGGYQALIVDHFPIVPGSVTILDTASGEEVSPDTYIVHLKGRRIHRKQSIWSVGAMRWEVTYKAGIAKTVAEVPADIKKAVLIIIEDETSETASGMRRETIGDYSYERFGGDEATGIMDEVERILAPRIRGAKFI